MNIRNSMVRADSWQTLVVSFDRIEYGEYEVSNYIDVFLSKII